MTESLETHQSPEFMTEVFTQFTELLKQSLLHLNNLDPMFLHLNSLVAANPSFTDRSSGCPDLPLEICGRSTTLT